MKNGNKNGGQFNKNNKERNSNSSKKLGKWRKLLINK